MFLLTDYNNLQHFKDIESRSLRQICWAQKLSKYYFWIDYCKGKANGAAHTLSQYPQQIAKKKDTFGAKNTKILYQLQFLFAWVSGLKVLESNLPTLLHQVFICGTVILPQLR